MPTPRNPARLIDRQAELDASCAAIAGQGEIALDTEFARTNTYRPQLCLLQVAASGEMFCIDTLAGLDTRRLWDALAATGSLKTIHAAKQDLEVLALRFGGLPGPLFDTQIAAALLGHPPQAGYAALVAAELGVHLEKTQTRTDWSRRPLTAAQVDYAGDDVAFLLELGHRLRERLATLDRIRWVQEDCAALLDPALYGVYPERAWERLTGVEYQPAAVQARVRRLAAWRERRADSADRPRQWILSDQALLALASANPRDVAGIERLDVLPAGAVRNSGPAVLAELRRADDDLASGAIDPKQWSRPTAPDGSRLKQLAGLVQKVAADLGIAPEILATRAELTLLLRGSREMRPLRGWRRAVIGDTLLGAL